MYDCRVSVAQLAHHNHNVPRVEKRQCEHHRESFAKRTLRKTCKVSDMLQNILESLYIPSAVTSSPQRSPLNAAHGNPLDTKAAVPPYRPYYQACSSALPVTDRRR
jgi:hypothetical protein